MSMRQKKQLKKHDYENFKKHLRNLPDVMLGSIELYRFNQRNFNDLQHR